MTNFSPILAIVKPVAMLERIRRSPAFIRFGLSGALNTIASWLLFVLLLNWLPYQVAYGIAYAVGIVTGYFLATLFVFAETPTARGLFSYPIVYVVQYGLSAALLVVVVEWLDVPVKIAPLVVAVLVFPVTFVLSRIVVRRTSRPPSRVKGPS